MPREFSPPAIMTLVEGDVRLTAASITAADGVEKKGPRRFSMVGYSGGTLNLGWGQPVVVDIAGMEVPTQQMPILVQHGWISGGSILDTIVGQTTSIEKGSQVIAIGNVLGKSPAVAQIVALNDEGFKFQASIGADVLRAEAIDSNTTVTVNGQTFTGPLYVVRSSRLREISFVVLGADHATSASIAASIAAQQQEPPMSALNTAQAASIAAAAAQATNGQSSPNPDAAPQQAVAAQSPAPIPPTFTLDQVRAAGEQGAMTAYHRIARIEQLAANHPTIRAQAVAENWSPDQVELAVLRAERGSGGAPNIISRPGFAMSASMLECSLMISTQAMKEQEIVAKYGEQMVDQSNRAYRGGFGIKAAIRAAAREAGEHVEDITASNARTMLKASFSSMSLPNILGAVANKRAIAGFASIDQSWREIAAVNPTRDFKTTTGVRLAGNMTFEKVGSGGEVKHGTVTEAAYTNKADLMAKLFTIPIQAIVNDDTGVLKNLPFEIGLGAGYSLNETFWGEFVNNTSFFTAGRGNFDDGADSALSVDGLSAAEVLLNSITNDAGKPLALSTEVVTLVPPALAALARQLYGSELLLGSSGPSGNPHRGNYRVVMCPYLSNALISGYSAKKWYLIRKPIGSLGVIEVVFLDGVETPTIESVDLDADNLGIGVRGWWGFGTAKQEYRMGVAMKGEV